MFERDTAKCGRARLNGVGQQLNGLRIDAKRSLAHTLYAPKNNSIKTKPAPISRGRLVETRTSEPFWLLLFLRSSLFLRSRFLLSCVLHRVILPLHQIKRYSSKRARSCPLYKVERIESQEKNELRGGRAQRPRWLDEPPKTIKRGRVELF